MLGAYDAAYVAAQERLGFPVTIRDNAALVTADERGSLVKALSEKGLERGDFERLARVYTARAAADPAFAMEIAKAVMASKNT